MRRGELPNRQGEFPCPEAGCSCRFFTELDALLHARRGRHGQMNFMDTFRRVRGGYSGQRPKERAYARQQRLWRDIDNSNSNGNAIAEDGP